MEELLVRVRSSEGRGRRGSNRRLGSAGRGVVGEPREPRPQGAAALCGLLMLLRRLHARRRPREADARPIAPSSAKVARVEAAGRRLRGASISSRERLGEERGEVTVSSRNRPPACSALREQPLCGAANASAGASSPACQQVGALRSSMVSKPGAHPRFEREALQEPLAEGMDGLHGEAARRVDREGEQAGGPGSRPGVARRSSQLRLSFSASRLVAGRPPGGEPALDPLFDISAAAALV